MMASNLLSRLLPSASDEPYETLPLNPQHNDRTSFDGHGEMDIDEENLEARFEAQDLENLLEDATSSQMTTESTAFLPPSNDRKSNIPPSNKPISWRQAGPSRVVPLDDDDDVPQSLLLEGGRDTHRAGSNTHAEGLPPPVPGPSTRQTRAQWETTRMQQRLHDDGQNPTQTPIWSRSNRPGQLTADPKEKALWLWVNVTDLDTFLAEVYTYYTQCGIYSMLLRQTLTLLQTGFVVAFVTFLGWCIDYSKISNSHRMSEVIVAKCTKNMHGFWIFALWLFIMYWLHSLYQLLTGISRLRSMHDFFHYLLDIPDRDIQTVQWQQVVSRIMALRDQNLATASNLSPETRKLLDHKSRQRLDAIDIASRLMRRDNYLIALFNKEILDVAISVPFLGTRNTFSETTRWHLNLAVMDFVFSSGTTGQFNEDFLKERNRRDLVKKLKARFLGVGLISII